MVGSKIVGDGGAVLPQRVVGIGVVTANPPCGGVGAAAPGDMRAPAGVVGTAVVGGEEAMIAGCVAMAQAAGSDLTSCLMFDIYMLVQTPTKEHTDSHLSRLTNCLVKNVGSHNLRNTTV